MEISTTTEHEPPRKAPRRFRLDETVWVLCLSPITLLMPTAAARQALGAAGTTPVQAPLRLERGLNVLAGPVTLPNGKVQHMTLDGLSAELQQITVEERCAAVFELFEQARTRYAIMFQAVGSGPTKIPARIAGVGTMHQLLRDHYAALLLGASNGTHRASLEALVHHAGDVVPEHIKDLARARLNAWRPAA